MTDEVIISTSELLKVYASAVDEALVRIRALEEQVDAFDTDSGHTAAAIEAKDAEIAELEEEIANLEKWVDKQAAAHETDRNYYEERIATLMSVNEELSVAFEERDEAIAKLEIGRAHV